MNLLRRLFAKVSGSERPDHEAKAAEVKDAQTDSDAALVRTDAILGDYRAAERRRPAARR